MRFARIVFIFLSTALITSLAFAQSLSETLGLIKGSEVRGAVQALEQLDRDFPAQVEVYLNYPKSKSGTYLGDGKESNPFGHIAIRINDDVYTVNHLAELGVEKNVMHKSPLKEYLYTTQSYYAHEEFTGMQGQAYAKDTVSIRIDGLSQASIQTMAEEVQKIEREWQEGRLSYSAKNCNCADLTLRILKAGGVVAPKSLDKRKIKMPLDVFEEAVKAVKNKVELHTSMILYGYVKSSKNEYRTAGFPLSLYQLGRASLNFFRKGRDPLEKRIDAQIVVSKDSDVARYERITPQMNEMMARIVLTCEGMF